jgi:hypothetical protein
MPCLSTEAAHVGRGVLNETYHTKTANPASDAIPAAAQSSLRLLRIGILIVPIARIKTLAGNSPAKVTSILK